MLSRALLIGSLIFAAYVVINLIDVRSRPRLQVAPEFNFGNRKPGDLVTIPVKLENIGGGRLLIHSFKASCGCATVDFQSRDIPIPAGASAEAIVNIKGGRNGGKMSVEISINSNDAETPTRNIKFAGEFVQ